MTDSVWRGTFVSEELPTNAQAHELDVTGFSGLNEDAIVVRTVPEGITIPVEIGKLISNERFLFGPFLKEALEKCATMIVMLYTTSGATPKLVTEAKKYAERAAKFGGSVEFSQMTRTFVEALQTIGQVVQKGTIPHETIVAAFSSFQTIATFRNNAMMKLGDNIISFAPMVEVLDSLALPAKQPRRDMLALDRGNIANVFRNVLIGMIYFLQGDLSNAQLYNNYAYSASVWWALLFKNAPPTQLTKKK